MFHTLLQSNGKLFCALNTYNCSCNCSFITVFEIILILCYSRNDPIIINKAVFVTDSGQSMHCKLVWYIFYYYILISGFLQVCRILKPFETQLMFDVQCILRDTDIVQMFCGFCYCFLRSTLTISFRITGFETIIDMIAPVPCIMYRSHNLL